MVVDPLRGQRGRGRSRMRRAAIGSIIDDITVSGSLEERVVEYVDHLHEHVAAPAIIRDGRFVAPSAPGYCVTMRPDSLARFAFPDGVAWRPAIATRSAR